jgi:hypothetical protein
MHNLKQLYYFEQLIWFKIDNLQQIIHKFQILII